MLFLLFYNKITKTMKGFPKIVYGLSDPEKRRKG